MRKKWMAIMLAVGMTMCGVFGMSMMTVQAASTQVERSFSYYASGNLLEHDPQFDKYEKVYGIDVSKWQKTIDWSKVKKAGVQFAILRVGYSSLSVGETNLMHVDEYFYQYIKDAHEAGIDLGVYYFTQAITTKEAKAEAEYVLNILKPYGTDYLKYPVYFDMEMVDSYRLGSAKLTNAQRTAICRTFCDTIAAAGYDTGVYANYNEFNDKMNKSEFAGYNNWLARYDSAPSYKGKYFDGSYNMWQFSSMGLVDGITGTKVADLDVYYRSGKPAKPKNLKQVNLADEAVDLSWDEVKYADGYQLVLMDAEGNKIKSAKTTTNSYQWLELQTNTKYKYKVRAYYTNSDGTTTYGSYSTTIDTYTTPAKIEGITQIANSSSTATISWTPVPIAAGYRVRFYDESTQKYTTAGTTAKNTYKVTDLEIATSYPIIVQPYVTMNGSTKKYGPVSEVYTISAELKQTSGVKYTKRTASAVTLTWEDQDNVDGFEIDCYDSNRKLISTDVCDDATYTKKGLDFAKEYFFEIRSYALLSDGAKVYGTYSEWYPICTLPEQIKNIKADNCNSKSIVLSWDKITGADGYQVYSYDTTKKKKTLLQAVTTEEYKVTKLSEGKKYCFVVAAYIEENGKKYNGVISDVYEAATKPGKVTELVAKSSSAESVKITWKSVANATGYEISCYDAKGALVGIKDTAKIEYKWKKLSSASNYTFVVRAYIEPAGGVRAVGTDSAKLLLSTKPAQVKGLKEKSVKKNSVTIAWNKVEGALGYRIYQYNEKTGKSKFLVTVDKTSYTIKDLKSATTYQLRVRAYVKNEDSSTYGALSDILKVKTK